MKYTKDNILGLMYKPSDEKMIRKVVKIVYKAKFNWARVHFLNPDTLELGWEQEYPVDSILYVINQQSVIITSNQELYEIY